MIFTFSSFTTVWPFTIFYDLLRWIWNVRIKLLLGFDAWSQTSVRLSIETSTDLFSPRSRLWRTNGLSHTTLRVRDQISRHWIFKQLFNSKTLDVVKSQILVYRLTQHARQLKQSYLTELTWIRTCECRVTYHAHRYPPASLPALDQQTQAAIFPPASPLNTSTAFTPIKNLGMRYVETDGWSFQIDGSHCSFKYRIEIEWNGALRASSVSFPRAEGNTSFLSELSKTQFD